MLHSVFGKSLRDNRRALLWWIFGIVVLIAGVMAFYPQIKNEVGLNELLKSPAVQLVRGSGNNFTSPAGFLNSELFALMAPILLIIYAINIGVAGIAGEEDRRTLPLLLAAPLSRTRLYLEKWLVMVTGTTILAAIMLAAIVAMEPAVDLHVSTVNLSETVLAVDLLAILFGTLSFAVGAIRGSKGLAIAVASATATAAYFLNALVPLVPSLKGAEIFSPFHYYIGNDPILNGVHWADLGILAAVIVVLLVVGAQVFRQRDINA